MPDSTDDKATPGTEPRYAPILFSAPMVRAILAGKKAQTRRILKPQPNTFHDDGKECEIALFQDAEDKRPRIRTGRVITTQEVRWQTGDRLWVRENLRVTGQGIEYAADETLMSDIMNPANEDRAAKLWDHYAHADGPDLHPTTIPSIHMPRWASRITLEVTGVRVERLQDISRGDAMVEGCPFQNMQAGPDPRHWYRDLWNDINGVESWGANPWVAVIEFQRVNDNGERIAA